MLGLDPSLPFLKVFLCAFSIFIENFGVFLFWLLRYFLSFALVVFYSLWILFSFLFFFFTERPGDLFLVMDTFIPIFDIYLSDW